LDKYLETDTDLTRCLQILFSSQIFKNNKAYVRRKLVNLLLKDDELDLPRKILVGAFLLIDGRLNQLTLEMMREESVISCVVDTIWKRQSESIRLRRIFLELFYEICRVQKLSLGDLAVISPGFIDNLFTAIEDNEDYDHDPYSYAVIKVLLALNEQYMIASYDMFVKTGIDGREPHSGVHRAASFPLTDIPHHTSSQHLPLPNLVIETLIKQRDTFRVFGENIVFLLNRSPDDTIQLMVLKLLYIIFTTPETANYLYLNDLKVIVDVFVRELYNLSNEEERLRHTYLRVLHPLLQNTELAEVCYKRDEIIGLLESMSEHADKSVVEISETTKRLAYRCLLVEWLNHSALHNNVLQNAVEDSSSYYSASTASLDKHSQISPNSTGTPISPISSDSFNCALNLAEETSQNQQHQGFQGKPAPPPPPPRVVARASTEPLVTKRAPPPAPPRPLPRKQSLVNLSIRNTSVMDLASYSLTRRDSPEENVPPVPDIPTEYLAAPPPRPPSSRQPSQEKALPPPPPPPPRMQSSPSIY
jgi:hypothetical protein